MNVRIVSSPWKSGDSSDKPLYDVFDANMREKLHERLSFNAAIKALEREVKQERLACGTGGCED